ncbi:MAG: mandelate racemase/muconate lactonizing enzyme family protein [Woeseiaceae bacterium]
MRVVDIELFRYRIPFKVAFSHAAATRGTGDAILIRIGTEEGVSGYGEIQARPYVTGEANDTIWSQTAVDRSEKIIGRTIRSTQDIRELVDAVCGYAAAPALAGGFDLALHDAIELTHGLDWSREFGPLRKTPIERCLTIGENHTGPQLERQSRMARLSGCAVVKLKVKNAGDARRIHDLRTWLGPEIAIRLDANGCMDVPEVVELLRSSARCRIESIEEPLRKDRPDLTAALNEVHAETGVPLVADESICTAADVARLGESGSYQIVNVRVGKCGGISGTRAVIDSCRKMGLKLVAGTMVGETAVLLRASRMLLTHCEELRYVEGLDQARQLLEAQPILEQDAGGRAHFNRIDSLEKRYCVAVKTVPKLMARPSPIV